MCKFVKSRVAIAVFVLSLLVPLSGYAGIGAEPNMEPNNKPAEMRPVADQMADPMAGIPPYPGTTSGTERSILPQAQMYPQPYSGEQFMPQGQMYLPPYPGTTSGPNEQFMPQGQMYLPPPVGNQPYPIYDNAPMYGNVPGMLSPYGDQSGIMYPSYPNNISPATYPGAYQTPWYQPPADYPYPPQMPYGSADQVYNQAMQAYRSRDYGTALAKFQEVAANYPQSDLVDNAYYWMGEIQYSGRNFPAAIQLFQMVLYSYPNGNKAPDAFVKMGYAYAELRQYSTAKAVLNDVVARYSNNKRIRDLAMRKLNEIKNLY